MAPRKGKQRPAIREPVEIPKFDPNWDKPKKPVEKPEPIKEPAKV